MKRMTNLIDRQLFGPVQLPICECVLLEEESDFVA